MSALQLPLNFLERPAAPDTASPWLLVLMHGVGSNEQDLIGLAPYLPPQFHVLSLQAPYRMGPNAYGWFEFSIDSQGQRHIDVEQEVSSRALVAQTVAQAAEQLGIAASRVVVGGFSQGGIMALTTLLTQPQVLRAAMVWHSRLLPQALAQAVPAADLAGRALWVSHGLQDNVIPISSAQQIRDHAAQLPLALTYREYPGVHEIRPQELADSVQWLHGLTLEQAS